MSKRKHIGQTPVQALLPTQAPTRALVLFSLGQFGWSLGSFAVGNLLVYFYMPPEQGTAAFPTFIYQGPVLAMLTLIGILSAGGRLLDGFVDPFVAHWSDRKNAAIGKRRWFLLRAAIPFGLLGALVFFPAVPAESATNFIWLALIISLYYFFFAFYVIPYNALMAELGHTAQERLRVSTMVSVAWALGFVAGNSAYALQGFFESMGYTAVAAFQTAIVLLQGLAIVFMLLPALFLNEQRYALQSPSEQPFRDSVKMVLKNRNFSWFLLSYLLYWLSLTFIQLGIGFYTTILFGLDKSMAFNFSLVSFAASFVLYWPINQLSSRVGKRGMMLVAYLIFGLIFLTAALAPQIPLPKDILLYCLGVAAAGPLAIFGILPNAIVGDEAARHLQSGAPPVTGMFFGVTAFTMKLGISLANLIFPSLLLFGKSDLKPTGVQLTALAALIFCMAGWWAYKKYEHV